MFQVLHSIAKPAWKLNVFDLAATVLPPKAIPTTPKQACDKAKYAFKVIILGFLHGICTIRHSFLLESCICRSGKGPFLHFRSSKIRWFWRKVSKLWNFFICNFVYWNIGCLSIKADMFQGLHSFAHLKHKLDVFDIAMRVCRQQLIRSRSNKFTMERRSLHSQSHSLFFKLGISWHNTLADNVRLNLEQLQSHMIISRGS